MRVRVFALMQLRAAMPRLARLLGLKRNGEAGFDALAVDAAANAG